MGIARLEFSPMDTYPIEIEGAPFLVLRHGNDMHSSLIQQVQNFEGGIYPDELDGLIDHADAVSDAIGWANIAGISEPITVEYK